MIEFRKSPTVAIKDFFEKPNWQAFKLLPTEFVLNRPLGPPINDSYPLHTKFGSNIGQRCRNKIGHRIAARRTLQNPITELDRRPIFISLLQPRQTVPRCPLTTHELTLDKITNAVGWAPPTSQTFLTLSREDTKEMKSS